MPPVKDPYEDKLSRARDFGDEDYKRKIPEHFNAGHRQAAENPTDPRGNDVASGDASDPRGELAEQENDAATVPRSQDEDVGTQENRGDSNWKTNVEESSEKPTRSPLQTLKRKRNAVVVAFTIFAASAGIIAFITAPAFFLVHLKEVYLKKFGDRMQSLQQVRVNRIVAKQLAEDPFTAGCGTVKVKCRYKGMTDRQIKKFIKRNPGVQIRTEGKTAFGRNKIGSIGFNDDNGRFRYIAANDFKRAAKNSTAFKRLIINYNKSKVAMLRDKTAGKVFSKLKISTAKVRAARGPPQTEEEVQKQRADRIEKRDARRLAISQKYGGAIKSTNVISSLCAIRDLITVAKVAVKVTLAADEARAAMNTVGRPGDTIKAGLATGDNQTSNALANAASILNEEDKNGKVATDSYGYQYASRGVLIKDKGNQEDYQLGVNGKGVLGDIANASQGVSGLSTVTAGVNKVLNQEVCTVAGIASLALCLATVGFGCAINGAASIALQAIALPLILKKLIKTPDVETAVGGDKGDAITGGFSYLTKTNNQYHGGYPLTKNQAIRYDTFSDNAQNGGNWEESTAFDIHNTDSFAGKLASAFLPSMARMSTSPSSIPTTLTHLASSNLSHTASTAQAASVIDGEYDQCKDADYKALDLATDPFCVPQYGFNPSLMLGDSDYNKPSAALEDDEKPKESGFSLAWLFETPTAQAAVDNRGGFIPDNRYDADLVVNFMHDGAKPWIDDEGTGISYDDSDDDYIDYSKECLETTDPLEPSSPDMCKPKKCTEASSGSNEFRYCMYSVYAGDSSIDDQLEDRDASGGGGDSDANNEDTSSSGEAGEVKALAQELLDNPNVTYPYTDTRGVNVREVLQEVARTGKGIVNSPDVSFDRVEVSPDMLQAIADYAKNNKIGLNALTNADHSSGSNHYKGIAVDFACNPPFNRLEFEQIAAKYGGKNNGEVCPGAAHWHYDFPKRGTN